MNKFGNNIYVIVKITVYLWAVAIASIESIKSTWNGGDVFDFLVVAVALVALVATHGYDHGGRAPHDNAR